MEFKKSAALTFGLELEFQIINRVTGLLSPSSLEILNELAGREDSSRFSLEATLSTLEINSSIHTTATAMKDEIERLTERTRTAASVLGLNIRGGGTQMTQFWNERIMAPTERAKELEAQAQAQALRAEAYRDSLELESNVRTLWTDDDVNQAKRAFCI